MPAYSIGKAKRQATFINNNSSPGVGTYKMSTWQRSSRIKTAPASSMPKAKKFFSTASNVSVGPGTYNPQKKQMKIMVSMKGKSLTNFRTQTPSSTAYHTEIKYPSKQYSFTKFKHKNRIQQSPGPTQYHITSTQNIPSTIFGKQQRIKINNQYSSRLYYFNNSSHQNSEKKIYTFLYSFPKQQKFIAQINQEKIQKCIPGPATYTIGQLAKKFKGGKFTKQQRISLTTRVGGPGPATYYPKDVSQKSQPKPTIGNEKRQLPNHQSRPGPSTYHPNPQIYLRRQHIVSFSHADRIKRSPSATPGPGTYSTNRSLSSKSYSMSARFLNRRSNKSPGPQDYSPQYKKIQQKPLSIIFGTQDKILKINKQIPGPGQYKLDTSQYSKTFHFNKAKKLTGKFKLTPNVGPGSYKLKPFIGIYDGYEKDVLYV